VKKIVLAIENFSRYAGGAESYGVELATTLVENGWEVHFYGEKWDGEPKEAVFHEISVPRFLPSWAKILFFALKHKKMVQGKDFDVVLGFGNTIYMNVYQSHGGVHKYSTARKVYSENFAIGRFIKRLIIPLSLKYWVRHWIESAPFRLRPEPNIIAISDMISDDIEKHFGLSRDRIEIIYNGVDTSKYNTGFRGRLRGPLREKMGIQDDDVVFLFVSYDLKKKGIEPLVEASSLLKDSHGKCFKVVILGGEPYPSLLKKVRMLGVESNIIFAGRSRSIEEYYANSDVLVLPTYYDACSLVVIEAMASGLPSITTIYNGASGIINDGKDGFVISHPPKAEELAEKMKLLLNYEKREKMSVNAQNTGGKYTTEWNHREMLRIFDKA
jgi:UDP-glucose:(heptosyl)LPS alpha-1,3-glucosyltransferase